MPLDAKFFSDREKLPDSHEFQLPDGSKVTMGDLRSFYGAREQELTARQQEIANVQQQYAALAENFNAIQAELEQLRKNPQAGPEDLLKVLAQKLTGDQNPDIFSKPGEYFKPLVDRISSLEKGPTEIKAALDALKQDITKSFAWQLRRNLQSDFGKHEWPEGFTFEKALQYANQKGYVNPLDNNYPDFDRINNEVMGPTRSAKHDAELKNQYIEEGKRLAREEFQQGAHVPTPGFGGANPASIKSKYGSIEAIPEDVVLSDPDVFGTIQ